MEAGYDVFLSFKGEVRNSFACVLCEALKTAGFQPFMDEDNVLPGDELTPTIYEAIEKCKSAIVIFSNDYASSRWCLNELALLLDRRDETETFFIIPILYHLRTDDVRIRFCKEVEKHRPKADDLQIDRWKKALVKIADTKSSHFRELDMVTNFADKIAQRFKEIFSAKYTLSLRKMGDTSKGPIKGRSSVVNFAPQIDAPVGLVKEVSDFSESVRSFKSNWERLEDTMHAISPVFDDIESINRELDRPPNQIDLFKDVKNEATDLIRRCSRINSLNILKKSEYSNKLHDFEDTLEGFFRMDVQAQQLLSIAQVSKDVKDLFYIAELSRREIIHDLSKKLDSIHGTTGSSNISSSSSQYSGIGELPEFIVGLDFPLKELKSKLLSETVLVTPENKTSPVVVLLSAPPGCGKTTLANMVCRDSKIREKFKKNVFFAVVSKTVDIKDIVKQIFKHKGREDELREVQNDEQAINKLRNLLMEIGGGPDQNPILLVLDDVWSPELTYLVDRFMFKRIPGYKILVTSRSHRPAFQFVCKLKPLDHKEAMELFRHYAFPSWSPHTNVSDGYVDKIVGGCKGCAMALKVVALSLCGKDEVFWKTKLKKWSERKSSIMDSSSDLLEMLKKSLDTLDDEKDLETLKECFLDLGSFPEDQRIPASTLMDMWAELYSLDEEDMYTYSNLLELSYRNLLDLVPVRKNDSSDYCSGRFVKQHDMLRELAIYTSSQEDIKLRKRFLMEIGEKGLPQKLVENLDKPQKARLLSISTDDSFTSSWYDVQFPEAEVLVLNFRQRNYALPQFMENMKKLKVLILTNYSLYQAQVPNLQVVGCLSGLKRMRLEHVSITASFEFPHLQKLKKISLIMCKIGKALEEFARMFPNLEEIEMEYCRDLVELPAGLCHIVSLKRISITCCNEFSALPEEIEGLTNLQLLRLSSCTKLKELPEKIVSLQKLSIIDVSDCIELCKMPIQMGELKGLKELHMRGCSGLSELPPSVEELKNLIVFCDRRAASLWRFYKNVKVTLVKEDISLDSLHI